ncbi:MAG TPA: polysaccharide biosynthesis tyrosine autokinase [Blastocatellia bacterium]|nr:polysaccharide biosynthesis tyrosine autokinase [Blastocatellia bacterium]
MAKNDRVGDYGGVRRSILQEVFRREFPEPHLAPMAGPFQSLPREDLGFREFWRDLQRRWLVLLSAVVLITGVAAVFIIRTKSTYLASAVLVIGQEGPTLAKAGERLLQTGDSEAETNTTIKTKMVMIKSHELLEEVVVKLRLDRDPAFMDGPVRAGAPERESSVPAAQEHARLAPYVNLMDKNLTVEHIKETRAIRISFIHTSPEIAAAVADGVAQHFIDRNFQNRTENVTNVASWLERSTADLKERAQKAEQALADYTRANGIFTTDGSSTLTASKLAQLNSQVTRAETDRIMKETMYEEMKTKRVTEVPEVPDVFAATITEASPRMVELQKQLDDLITNEAQLSVHYGPSHPQLQEVRQQIAVVKDQLETGRNSLNTKLQAEYETALRHEQSLKTALAKAKAEAVDENQSTIQYTILKQEVDTATSLYTELLQASNQSKIQVTDQPNNIRIIDHAQVPTVPHGPKRALNLVLWLAVSLMVGLGLAMLLEFLDNTIKNDDDVTQFLQLSTLAVIPGFRTVTYQLPAAPGGQEVPEGGGALRAAITKGKEWFLLSGDDVPDEKDGWVAAEAYHTLRTSVLLATAEGLPKTILVTSSQAGEGKTMTAINLAFSLCELDARVLLIDADLRRPKAHQIFSLDWRRGLSTYLSKEVPISKLIQQLSKPQLSFMASGPPPPNPASLISSPKMKMLLELLNQDYDYIVIDSPPFGGVSDAKLLSTIVDGVILVVHGFQSKRDVVRRVRHDLSSVGARIIGVVLNNVNLKNGGFRESSDPRYYFKRSE